MIKNFSLDISLILLSSKINKKKKAKEEIIRFKKLRLSLEDPQKAYLHQIASFERSIEEYNNYIIEIKNHIHFLRKTQERWDKRCLNNSISSNSIKNKERL